MAEMESNKFLDCVRNHTTTTYAMVSTASTRQMAKFFEDLEFPCEQQMEEVRAASQRGHPGVTKVTEQSVQRALMPTFNKWTLDA